MGAVLVGVVRRRFGNQSAEMIELRPTIQLAGEIRMLRIDAGIQNRYLGASTASVICAPSGECSDRSDAPGAGLVVLYELRQPLSTDIGR
jgi:hypothetical protein